MKLTEEQLKTHKIALAFGSIPSRSAQFSTIISEIIDKLQITELLDYGCGNGDLVVHLRPRTELTIQRYDPAVEEFSGEPLPMQMVAAIDVLNVVEPSQITPMLEELKHLAGTVLFIVIGPTMEPAASWFDCLAKHFDVHTYQALGPNECFMICYAKRTDSLVEH